MTDLGTLTVAWKWLEDSELCAGSQLKPFGHAIAWNAFNADQSRIGFFRQTKDQEIRFDLLAAVNGECMHANSE
jgi:hypothetical protein